MLDNYIDLVQQYCNQGFRIYYQDETWAFKNMSCPKIWKDRSKNSTTNMYNVPSGSGERSIVTRIGCDDTGLLDNCQLLFRGSKSNKSSDCHTEISWDVFRHYCETKVFPKIAEMNLKSVVVLDRTTNHTVLDDEYRRPFISWNKADLSIAANVGENLRTTG